MASEGPDYLIFALMLFYSEYNLHNLHIHANMEIQFEHFLSRLFFILKMSAPNFMDIYNK